MRKSFVIVLLVVAPLSVTARAQGIQNNDVFIGLGPVWTKSHLIPGTDIAQTGSTGFNFESSYGYQIERISAIAVLLDLTFASPNTGTQKANLPGSPSIGDTGWAAATAGLRFMFPVRERLSFYGVAGGGWGGFTTPVVTAATAAGGGNATSLPTSDSTHGVFAFGGGADLRLSRWFSLRAEVRDFVSGRDLSGAGRNHVLPVLGFALHF